MATFGENFASDLTEEELENMLGLDTTTNDTEDDWESFTYNNKNDLSNSDYEIDWCHQGKVHSVKNQSSCGSCWSFAAVLALESMVAIENDTAPVRLSE